MQVFVVCPSHAWGVVGAYGQRCLSENPSSRQARLLLRARWGQKLYLGDPGSRGKGFLLHMAEQRKGGRGRNSRAKDTREERMLVAVFKLGTSWCDSVHWGQKEKEVGVAEIWNARSLHKSFSWKEPIKMVFRKKKYHWGCEKKSEPKISPRGACGTGSTLLRPCSTSQGCQLSSSVPTKLGFSW